MYLTYEEYQNMGGALNETTFNNLEFEAEAVVNWYTFSRLKNNESIPVPVKRLMYYLINLAEQKANLLGASGSGNVSNTAIASQSNDGVSISYNVLNAQQLMDSLKGNEDEAVKRYLQGVTNEAGQLLLYRGIYPNE